MSQNFPRATTDNGRIIAASGWMCGTIKPTTNHTITEAELALAGGHLHIICDLGPVVIWLPNAKKVPGAKITMVKAADGTNAFSFNATNGATIEGSLADKAYKNATAEPGSCTIATDGVKWRVLSQKGTWAIDNA